MELLHSYHKSSVSLYTPTQHASGDVGEAVKYSISFYWHLGPVTAQIGKTFGFPITMDTTSWLNHSLPTQHKQKTASQRKDFEGQKLGFNFDLLRSSKSKI